MPQLDVTTFAPQLVWLAITFAAMFFIMWKIAVPKISDALETRQMRLEDNLKKAEDLKREAEATLASYEKALADARAEAHADIQKIQQQLHEAAAKEEAELGDKLDAKIAASEKAIAAEVTKAMESVREVAIDVAAEAVQKLTGEAPQGGKVESAVDGVLKG
ncbi:F0F1 ATP synthase subunit B' [Thalassospiraceae bacterium LMO-JJ14]|nr:F0F1 ATP synthase subunit B' [Thalassospiraceae bacterium LMO-JJ14]